MENTQIAQRISGFIKTEKIVIMNFQKLLHHPATPRHMIHLYKNHIDEARESINDFNEILKKYI